ncbi:hypothetical protein [Streptomyces sp. NBC_00989]|uniref:hypothetical protein n=1 Tax=Streptomyces sp. NBC_00989 TaxID=2903705 RepID=UPI003867CCF2|nr:hypothetical protein OG714_00040 [Streptomyces sp. NBC_00989]WSW98159.1 hypothetical protein OG714_54100 [Streptomyces sp. NBC_00989]
MAFFGLPERVRTASRTVLDLAKRGVEAARRGLEPAEIWFQDHHVAVLVCVAGTVLPLTGLMMWTHWDAVTETARQVGPVLTVISIITGAVLRIVRWVRKRRADRLAQVITLPAARNTESGTETSPATETEARTEADGGAHDDAA